MMHIWLPATVTIIGSPGPGARLPLIERFNDTGGLSGGAGPTDGPSATPTTYNLVSVYCTEKM